MTGHWTKLGRWLFYLLNMWDAGATLHLVGTGGGMEAIPIMAFMLAAGVPYFVSFKLIIAAILMSFLIRIEREGHDRVGPIVTWLMVTMYTAVGINCLTGFI